MTKKSWFGALGVGLVTLTLGCSQSAPTAPSNLATSEFGAASDSTASTAYSYPVVTLQSDGRASPARVTVPVGYKVLMVNHSSRYVLIRSHNCSQFSTMGLQPGAARHTMAFYTAGVTCDYFAWDGYPRKIYEGQVTVR